MTIKNATEIRRYTTDDISAIIDIVMKEVPELPNYQGIKLEPTRIRFLLENSARDESAFSVNLLVNLKGKIVGGIGAYCVTQLLSWDKSTGDIFLFIDPEYRTIDNAVSLVSTYVNWARRREARLIGLSHTSGYRGKEFDALLKRKCGFEVVGTLYRIRNV